MCQHGSLRVSCRTTCELEVANVKGRDNVGSPFDVIVGDHPSRFYDIVICPELAIFAPYYYRFSQRRQSLGDIWGAQKVHRFFKVISPNPRRYEQQFAF